MHNHRVYALVIFRTCRKNALDPSRSLKFLGHGSELLRRLGSLIIVVFHAARARDRHEADKD